MPSPFTHFSTLTAAPLRLRSRMRAESDGAPRPRKDRTVTIWIPGLRLALSLRTEYSQCTGSAWTSVLRQPWSRPFALSHTWTGLPTDVSIASPLLCFEVPGTPTGYPRTRLYQTPWYR